MVSFFSGDFFTKECQLPERDAPVHWTKEEAEILDVAEMKDASTRDDTVPSWLIPRGSSIPRFLQRQLPKVCFASSLADVATAGIASPTSGGWNGMHRPLHDVTSASRRRVCIESEAYKEWTAG